MLFLGAKHGTWNQGAPANERQKTGTPRKKGRNFSPNRWKSSCIAELESSTWICFEHQAFSNLQNFTEGAKDDSSDLKGNGPDLCVSIWKPNSLSRNHLLWFVACLL